MSTKENGAPRLERAVPTPVSPADDTSTANHPSSVYRVPDPVTQAECVAAATAFRVTHIAEMLQEAADHAAAGDVLHASLLVHIISPMLRQENTGHYDPADTLVAPTRAAA